MEKVPQDNLNQEAAASNGDNNFDNVEPASNSSTSHLNEQQQPFLHQAQAPLEKKLENQNSNQQQPAQSSSTPSTPTQAQSQQQQQQLQSQQVIQTQSNSNINSSSSSNNNNNNSDLEFDADAASVTSNSAAAIATSALLATATLRNLSDKMYEKRKQGAHEVEGVIKSLVAQRNEQGIKSVIKVNL